MSGQSDGHAHDDHGRAPLALVLIIVLSFASLILPGVAFGTPTAAKIKLRPSFGPPTTRTAVTGSGFGDTEEVAITFDGTDVGTATTDASGSFSRKVRVPVSAAPGSHDVTATGGSSGSSATASFLVRTDWPKFHFDMANSGSNPYENVLNPGAVSGLGVAWSYPTGDSVVSSAAVVKGVVYVGSFDGSVYAVDAATGMKRWSFATGDIVYASPAVANGVVYVSSFDGNLYALDAASGMKRWSYPATGTATVADGVVYVGGATKFFALDAGTGAKLWSYPAPNGQEPAVVDGVVYVGAFNSDLYALDASTGSKLWSFPAFVKSAPAVAHGVVYVGSFDGVWAIDTTTGQERWKYPTGSHVFSDVAIADGVIYFGSNDDNLYAVDASTGMKRWSFSPKNDVNSVTVANGVAYMGSSNKRVYALDASTGARLWSFRTKDGVYASPAVADGVVYVGAADDLTAFALP